MKTRWKEVVLALMVSMILALGGWVWNTQSKLVELQQEVSDHSRYEQTHKRFWKYHGWAKQQINDVRFELDLRPVTWPDQDDSSTP